MCWQKTRSSNSRTVTSATVRRRGFTLLALRKNQMPRMRKPRLNTSTYLSGITASVLNNTEPLPPRTKGSGTVLPQTALFVAQQLEEALPSENVKLLALEKNLLSGREVASIALAALPAPRLLCAAIGMMPTEKRAVLDENRRLRAALVEYVAPYASAGPREDGRPA